MPKEETSYEYWFQNKRVFRRNFSSEQLTVCQDLKKRAQEHHQHLQVPKYSFFFSPLKPVLQSLRLINGTFLVVNNSMPWNSIPISVDYKLTLILTDADNHANVTANTLSGITYGCCNVNKKLRTPLSAGASPPSNF